MRVHVVGLRIDPVMDWQPVESVRRLSSSVRWICLQHPTTLDKWVQMRGLAQFLKLYADVTCGIKFKVLL